VLHNIDRKRLWRRRSTWWNGKMLFFDSLFFSLICFVTVDNLPCYWSVVVLFAILLCFVDKYDRICKNCWPITSVLRGRYQPCELVLQQDVGTVGSSDESLVDYYLFLALFAQIATLRFGLRMMRVPVEAAVNDHFDPWLLVRELQEEVKHLKQVWQFSRLCCSKQIPGLNLPST